VAAVLIGVAGARSEGFDRVAGLGPVMRVSAWRVAVREAGNAWISAEVLPELAAA
jgi:hypothetical protein